MTTQFPPDAATPERALYRAHISRRDFKKTLEFIDAAKATDEASIAHEALLWAAIIAYARPFFHNEDPRELNPPADQRLEDVDLPALLGEAVALHERILLVRRKMIAHSESTFYPMRVIPPFIEESEGERASSGVAFASQSWHVLNEHLDLDAFRRIADSLHRHCLNRVFDLGRAQAATMVQKAEGPLDPA